MLIAKNFNREFLDLWVQKHKNTRISMEKSMSQRTKSAKLSNSSPASTSTVGLQRENENCQQKSINDTRIPNPRPISLTDLRSRSNTSSSTNSSSAERMSNGSRRKESPSPASIEDFCQSFEQAMTIASHAERAKCEARNALDRAETARSLAEQAWEQAMSAAEAAQSIARSGLAVAKLSLDVCNPRSKPNQPSVSLKSAYELFVSQKEPIMNFDRFQQALNYDGDIVMEDALIPFEECEHEELENEYPCSAFNCQTCHNRELAQQWRFFKASKEPSRRIEGATAAEQPRQRLEQSLRSLAKKREHHSSSGHLSSLEAADEKKTSSVPKSFEKYSSPLGQFSSTSPRVTKITNQSGAWQGKVSMPAQTANHIEERFFHGPIKPLKTRHSASDELEYLTFWPPYDVTTDEQRPRRDVVQQLDEGECSDESSRSAPVFVGVRSRRSDSTEDPGLMSPPLKPRQLQRLSDMEPTEENIRIRLQQAYQASMASAKRSNSCSSEPGADAARRPCSPLVLPEVDSGSNVQMLPNNVQVFQPQGAKSTTPPSSYHDNVTSRNKAYLSD